MSADAEPDIKAALAALDFCPGCHGEGYDEEVDIGVGTLRRPCPVCLPVRDALEAQARRIVKLEAENTRLQHYYETDGGRTRPALEGSRTKIR